MLLELYDAGCKGMMLPASALAAAANVPQSTAWRCMMTMTEHDLVARTPDPGDQRRILLGLTLRGRQNLEAILDYKRD
jgi:DNA-binding MarR family transcriptional regulator